MEQSRLSFQARDERNYHVFYQLVAAAMKSPELKAQYLLEPAKTFHYISQSGCYTLQDVDDAESFNNLRLAMNVLNMSSEMLDGIFSVLSAILWIGNLNFADTDKETCKLTSNDQKIVPKIAKLLGITEEQTARTCTIRQINVKGNVTSIGLKLNEVSKESEKNKFNFVHYRHVTTGIRSPRHFTLVHLLGWYNKLIPVLIQEQIDHDLLEC